MLFILYTFESWISVKILLLRHAETSSAPLGTWELRFIACKNCSCCDILGSWVGFAEAQVDTALNSTL